MVRKQEKNSETNLRVHGFCDNQDRVKEFPMKRIDIGGRYKE